MCVCVRVSASLLPLVSVISVCIQHENIATTEEVSVLEKYTCSLIDYIAYYYKAPASVVLLCDVRRVACFVYKMDSRAPFTIMDKLQS